MHASNQVTKEQLQTLPLTTQGVAYVLAVSQSDPHRAVSHGAMRNLIGEVPLVENGVSLQQEAESGEYLFLTELQLRRDLWGVYDQPTSIPLCITNASGRRQRTTYTADYLVIDAAGVIAYEIKADTTLDELCARRPLDWCRDEDGYHYLAAERYLSQLGIKHKTIANSQLSPLRANNIRLLCSSRTVESTDRLERRKRKVQSIVKSAKSVRASQVLDQLGSQDATPILHLIDEGKIFAAIDLADFTDMQHLWLAASQPTADTLQASCTRLADILRERRELDNDELADPKYYEQIALRLAIVLGKTRINPRHPERELSQRQIKRLSKVYREQNNALSLTPNYSRCGNRNSRLSSTHKVLLTNCIRVGRSDGSDPTVVDCYRNYVTLFEQHKADNDEIDNAPVSRCTFYRWYAQVPGYSEDAEQRGGRRLRNAKSPVYDPVHRIAVTTRAFAAAHIDHWLADFFVYVCTTNGVRRAARPWVTAMVDGFTNEILAIWMSFDSPSRKANCMVMRACALRHGKLPEIIVVDGGPDFRSVHFAVMLATYNITHFERPPEDPGFGQEIESLFAHLKTNFAKGKPGYGLSIEQSRAVSGAFKSEKKATLNLSEATELLELYAYCAYNETKRVKEFSDTRIEVRRKSLSMFPFSGRKIAADLRFMIATSVDAAAKTYTLQPRRGVHVNNVWFSHPRLINFSGYKKQISVRMEPYDPSIVYVAINHQWFVCHSSESSLNAVKSDESLLSRAHERYELGYIRKQIQLEQNRRSANLINGRLNELIENQLGTKTKSPVDVGSPIASTANDESDDKGSKVRPSSLPYDKILLIE